MIANELKIKKKEIDTGCNPCHSGSRGLRLALGKSTRPCLKTNQSKKS
jgi:hypothetical protein